MNQRSQQNSYGFCSIGGSNNYSSNLYSNDINYDGRYFHDARILHCSNNPQIMTDNMPSSHSMKYLNGHQMITGNNYYTQGQINDVYSRRNHVNSVAPFSSTSPERFPRADGPIRYNYSNFSNPRLSASDHHIPEGVQVHECTGRFQYEDQQRPNLFLDSEYMRQPIPCTRSKDERQSISINCSRTIIVNNLPQSLCSVEAFTSFYSQYGCIEEIICEPHQAVAYIRFTSAECAEKAAKHSPFGLENLKAIYCGAPSRCHLPSDSLAKGTELRYKQPHILLNSYKFESEEHLEKKRRVEELRIQRLLAKKKQKDLLKKMTTKLQDVLSQLTHGNCTDEKKADLRKLAQTIKDRINKLTDKFKDLNSPTRFESFSRRGMDFIYNKPKTQYGHKFAVTQTITDGASNPTMHSLSSNLDDPSNTIDSYIEVEDFQSHMKIVDEREGSQCDAYGKGTETVVEKNPVLPIDHWTDEKSKIMYDESIMKSVCHKVLAIGEDKIGMDSSLDSNDGEVDYGD